MIGHSLKGAKVWLEKNVDGVRFVKMGTPGAKIYNVTFKVANGSWDDGATEDKTVPLSGYEGDTLKLAADQIPAVGNKPEDNTYKEGSWNPTPSTDTAITEDTTYTYTYAKKDSISATVTFKVANGSWNDGTTEDKTVPLTGYEGDTLKLAADQIPAAGDKPDTDYKAGSWDTTPDTETAITEDMTYTYTYETAVLEKPVFPKTSYNYTGEEITLDQPTGFDDRVMTIDPDPPKATNAGTYTVTIGLKDKDNYRWSDGTTDDFTVNWTIDKVSNTITMSTGTVTKTGSVSKATVFTRAAKAKSRTVKYTDNSRYASVSSIGKVTINKNYTGTFKVTASSPETANYKAATKSYTVKVKPGKMAVKKAANVKARKIKATWTKMTGADKYQIRVAQNAKMTKGKKTYTAKGTAASKTTGRLTKGKTYYVQIRAYDTQTKSWGAWSAKKKVKISK